MQENFYILTEIIILEAGIAPNRPLSKPILFESKEGECGYVGKIEKKTLFIVGNLYVADACAAGGACGE